MKKGLNSTIEINDTYVKLVFAKSQRISYIALQKIDKNSEGALSQLLSKINFPRDILDGNLVAVIPRRLLVVKQISLPTQIEGELRRMVDLQVANHVPFPREEIIYDFTILQKMPSGYTRILLFAVHKDIVHRYLRILSQVRLNSQRFVLSSFGLLDWFVYISSRRKLQEELPVALINIDHQSTEICFFHNNQLLFSRNINFDVTEIEQDVEDFIEQIVISLGAYQREAMGEPISKIIVIANQRTGSIIAERIKSFYQLPVEVYTYSQGIPTEKNFDKSVLEKNEMVSIAPNVGFLLNEGSSSINLMPAEFQDNKRLKVARKVLVKVIVALLITISLALVAIRIGNYQDVVYLKKIEKKVRETQEGIKNAERQLQFLRFIKNETERRVLIADMFQELYDLTPEEISFQSLRLGTGGSLMLQGFADSSIRVNQFQRSMVNSDIFKDVTLQYATKRKRFKQEYTDFKITCVLEKPERDISEVQ